MLKKVFIITAICFMLIGCVSTEQYNRTVLEYQRQIDDYESQLRARDRTIERAIERLEVITGRSEAMGNDFDDVIRELDEYQRTIEQCLRDLRERTAEK